MGALRFILRRLAFSAVLILGVSFILFALINAIGNPIQILLADTPGMSDEMVAALSKFYGLDGSFIERYGAWLWAILHFDFGTSIIYNQPVADLLHVWGLETLKILRDEPPYERLEVLSDEAVRPVQFLLVRRVGSEVPRHRLASLRSSPVGTGNLLPHRSPRHDVSD